MPDPSEPKSEKLSVNVTPTELKALEFVKNIHGTKYEGVSSVLRDYSIGDAVQAYEKAKEEVSV